MNILQFHKNLICNYRSYIQSFLNIKDPRIVEFVEKEITNNKLWPEPLVQFNPTFEKGSSINDLVNQGVLHTDLEKIFTGYSLYRHQEEEIRLGALVKEFIVTSGTGSGKSLTFLATIFNHILKTGTASKDKVQLDAIYAKLYGLTTEELRYILDPQDVYGPDFPGETFRVLKEKEIRLYGEYRTKRLVMEAWERLNNLNEHD